MTDDIKLLEADDAYSSERARWGMRFNKAFSPGRHEVYRTDANGEPLVMAWSEDSDAAINEYEESRAIASMKAARKILNG